MRKKIDFCGDYWLNNPFVCKTPFRNVVMERAFLAYRHLRMAARAWLPLKEWQEFCWARESFLSRDTPNNPTRSEDGETTPYFKIHRIDFLEIIPKEEKDTIAAGINRIKNRFGKRSIFDREGAPKSENHTAFWDGDAYISLGAFSVNEKSKLGKYASQVHFRLVGISSSFYCLIIRVYINDELAKRSSDYVVSDVADRHYVSGFERLRWYEFSRLGFGEEPGYCVKRRTYDSFIEDLAWKTLRILNRYLSPLCFSQGRKLPPIVCKVNTNISRIGNSSFWNSLGIFGHNCDYGPNHNYCVAWCDNFIFTMFAENCEDVDSKINSGIVEYHLTDYLSLGLLCDRVVSELRTIMPMYSRAIVHKRKKLKQLLKLKAQLSNEIYYYMRFIRENDSFVIRDIDKHFINSGKTIAVKKNKWASENCKKTEELVDGLRELIQIDIDYRNEQNNHAMQNRSVFIAVLSLLVAVLSMVVTICLSEPAMNLIREWWNESRKATHEERVPYEIFEVDEFDEASTYDV